MSILHMNASACRHCYKCVRGCEVKAIALKNDQIQIIDNLCTLCGECLMNCPHEAIEYHEDIDKVRKWLKNHERVILSLAPSFAAAFPGSTPGQVIHAAHQVGFEQVRETAEVNCTITKAYALLTQKGQYDNIITTVCPTVNRLIEIHYPDLIPYMAPVIPPMIAHSRYIRSISDSPIKIVFVSSCLSQNFEAAALKYNQEVDAVLLYEELEELFQENHINRLDCAEAFPDNDSPMINKLYPISGGILEAVKKEPLLDHSYRRIAVSGIRNCIQVCKEMLTGTFHHCLIEMSACGGSCINGPTEIFDSTSSYKRRMIVENYAEHERVPDERTDAIRKRVSLITAFKNRSEIWPQPNEAQINRILQEIGQANQHALNCGACGYSNCREHAIAIFQGKADLSMCTPYLRTHAESLSNLVMDTTPNLIMIIDRNVVIREFSKSCEEHFHIDKREAIGKYLIELIDDTDYEWVLEHHRGLRNKTVTFSEYHFTALQNLVYIPSQESILAILIDITEEEKRAQAEYQKKMEIADVAQNVIEKQMMVAQTIAGLLGEITGETKVTLNNLCKSLLKDDNDNN